MFRIFINTYHHEPSSSALTGLNLTVQYPGGEAEVSILDIHPPLPVEGQEDGIRAVLLRLAEALTSAAQNPHGITPSPRPRD
jgi:hypothetical protein